MQLIAAAAAMVDVMVMALVVVSARTILPALGNALLAICMLRWGQLLDRGGGDAVSPMAYSTLAHFLTFSTFVASSQGHSVSSLSQLQSTSAAKRKGDSRPQKGNAAIKRRGKSDTNDGAKYKAAQKRRGIIDTKDDAKYNDEEDVLPVTDVPFGEKQWEERRLAAFNTATVIGNLRNATYQIAQQCTVSSKMDAATLHTKGALFYGPGHTDGMSRTLS
jgi:hypothetical protein